MQRLYGPPRLGAGGQLAKFRTPLARWGSRRNPTTFSSLAAAARATWPAGTGPRGPFRERHGEGLNDPACLPISLEQQRQEFEGAIQATGKRPVLGARALGWLARADRGARPGRRVVSWFGWRTHPMCQGTAPPATHCQETQGNLPGAYATAAAALMLGTGPPARQHTGLHGRARKPRHHSVALPGQDLQAREQAEGLIEVEVTDVAAALLVQQLRGQEAEPGGGRGHPLRRAIAGLSDHVG